MCIVSLCRCICMPYTQCIANVQISDLAYVVMLPKALHSSAAFCGPYAVHALWSGHFDFTDKSIYTESQRSIDTVKHFC